MTETWIGIDGTDFGVTLDLPDIGEFVNNAFSGIQDWIGNVFGKVGEFFGNIGRVAIEKLGDLGSNILGFLKDGLKRGVQAAVNVIKDLF